MKVLEWTQGAAGAYAGRLLSGLGVDTVRMVDPSAPASDNPWFGAFLDAGKECVTLDPGNPAARDELRALVATCGLVLVDDGVIAGGQSILHCVRAMSTTVPVVSITPFGLEGPLAGARGGDLELSCHSGLSYLTPRDIPRLADRDQPPLKMPGVLPSIYAGAAAAAACACVLLDPEVFRSRTLDVASLETLVPTLRRELALFQYGSVVASRFMRVWRLAPWGIKPCRDGFVFVQVVEKHHWLGLVDMMGTPAWAEDPRYLDPDYRFEHRQQIEQAMQPWLSTCTKARFAWECQKRALPFAPVNTVADVVRIPQLYHRRFWETAVSAAIGPCAIPRLPFVIDAPAAPGPVVAAASGLTRGADPARPLAGIRVADFGHVWAGPYCTQILADLGADVVKVESAERLDIHRRQGPYPGGTPSIDSSGVWNSQNRNKSSITLNLRTTEGRDLARRFAAGCDVVVENFAPGVMEKLDLDYDRLSALNPALVMLSLSAFGQDGPQKDNVGYGPSLDAWAGLDSLTAYDESNPGALGGIFPDTGSALHGAVAVLHGLVARNVSGRGRRIDVSELEVSTLFLADALCEYLGTGATRTKPGNTLPTACPYGVYRCSGEDDWVGLSVVDEAGWSRLCALIGRAQWAIDPALQGPGPRRMRQPEIDAAITAWTRRFDPKSCAAQLQAAGLRAAPVNTVRDVLEDPHLQARGYFQNVTHPVAGPLKLYGSLWAVVGEARAAMRPAPVLGDSTDRVLSLALGLSATEIADLRARKIVH
jgi:crotonobetainyl-CoA:carnitine CoA-transferase CaiB-like acyl-CoA transferase